jgi:hypothetical protein
MLFSENYQVHRYPGAKDIENMSKGWPSLPIEMSEFPNFPYPDPGSERHEKDLNTLQQYFFNPVNNQEFLKVSDDKPFKIYKDYAHKHQLNIDIDALDDLNEELARIILNLKFKFNRPRPKKYMEMTHSSFPYDRIEDNKSPSYPSGHTAHAFFNASIISYFNPDYAMKLSCIAELIGQSRIDLAKHYPSDVEFGRFLGEYIARKFINNSEGNMQIKESKQEQKTHTGRKRLVEYAKRHNEKKLGTSYVDELCEFIVRSNEIERYSVNIDEAHEAGKSFMSGIPVKYCTDNKYVRSHLDAIDAALNIDKVDTPKKVQEIHLALGDDVMERGKAGDFRDFSHFARSTGYPYSEPDHILKDVNDWCSLSAEPFTRHIVYECIHPFSDGNGRSGRIILLSDLDYDLAKINDQISHNYIQKLVDYQHSNGT